MSTETIAQSYHETMELVELIFEHVPEEKHDRAWEIIRSMMDQENGSRMESVVFEAWLNEKASLYKTRLETYLGLLETVLMICAEHGDGNMIEKVHPHMLTLKRFLEEQKAPEFTLEDARKKIETELQENAPANSRAVERLLGKPPLSKGYDRQIPRKSDSGLQTVHCAHCHGLGGSGYPHVYPLTTKQPFAKMVVWQEKQSIQ